jgi:hypothetical protein
MSAASHAGSLHGCQQKWVIMWLPIEIEGTMVDWPEPRLDRLMGKSGMKNLSQTENRHILLSANL